jgi:hypothetical protein
LTPRPPNEPPNKKTPSRVISNVVSVKIIFVFCRKKIKVQISIVYLRYKCVKKLWIICNKFIIFDINKISSFLFSSYIVDASRIFGGLNFFFGIFFFGHFQIKKDVLWSKKSGVSDVKKTSLWGLFSHRRLFLIWGVLLCQNYRV